MISWFRDRRREILDSPFSPAWLSHLRRNFAYFALLTSSEQSRLCDDLRIVVAEKNWEGCGALAMTDEIKVTVAAQACLLLLGMPHDYFAGVQSVLIYPDDYQAVEKKALWRGPYASVIIDEEPAGRRGQATAWGTVVLSWTGVLSGGSSPESALNLVFHEFAHELDYQDGSSNGVPRLPNEGLSAEWAEVMTAEFDVLVRATQEGRQSVLRAYGATNAAEFFAVATECFFGRPQQLCEAHPRLYKVLRAYYQQDPAERLNRHLCRSAGPAS